MLNSKKVGSIDLVMLTDSPVLRLYSVSLKFLKSLTSGKVMVSVPGGFIFDRGRNGSDHESHSFRGFKENQRFGL